jgi:outer membrane protein TolC
MRLLTLTSLVFCCLLSPARAQIDATNRPARPLPLQEAIRLALESNLEIARVRYEPQLARYQLANVSAWWEPRFRTEAEHRNRTTEGEFSADLGIDLPGSSIKTDEVLSTLTGRLPWTGLEYGISGSYNHDFGTRGFDRRDSYSTDLGISLSQPLLRNLWIDADRLQVRLARKDLKISEYTVMLTIMDVVNRVQQAYYDLIAAQDQVRARELSLTLADRLLQENKKRVEVGTMAPLDVRQAESEAALRRADLIQAAALVTTFENILKGLISNNYQMWHAVAVRPTEKLIAVPQTYDLQESWINGLTSRPDYNRAKETLERQGINVSFALNQLFPALNLTGTYGRSGFDSRREFTLPNSTNVIVQNPSFSATLDDIRAERNPRYSFGLVFEMPLTFRQERARLDSAKALREQAKLDLQIIHEQILVGIDDAIKAAVAAYERVQATRAGRDYAEQALEAAQKMLVNGRATSFEVLRLQRDLTDARAQEIDALADYNKALAELYFREGTILKKNNVQVEIAK